MSTLSPIFVGGMYKSGTSLLRAMLGQHPGLFSGFETGWCVPGNYENSDTWLRLLSDLFNISLPDLNLLNLRTSCVEEFIDLFMSDQAARAEKPRWVEKTPLNAANIVRILRYWPNARVIHIFRNPIDVYASLVFSGKWESPEEFAYRWCSTCGEAVRTVGGGRVRPRAVHNVQYESLVAHPNSRMREVCEFADVPWVSAVGEFKGTEKEARIIRRVLGRRSSTAERMREPLNAGRIGIWRQLSLEQRERFGLAVGQIAELGYGEEFSVISDVYRSSLRTFFDDKQL